MPYYLRDDDLIADDLIERLWRERLSTTMCPLYMTQRKTNIKFYICLCTIHLSMIIIILNINMMVDPGGATSITLIRAPVDGGRAAGRPTPTRRRRHGPPALFGSSIPATPSWEEYSIPANVIQALAAGCNVSGWKLEYGLRITNGDEKSCPY